MNKEIVKFFKVILEERIYLNLLYLLLAFPLGIFYFTFLVTGISLGIGLAITLFGIPLLFGMLLLWRVLGIFEREQAKVILKIDISDSPLKRSGKFWETIKAYLGDAFTWKSLVYLFIKFPLGIFSFVVLVTLLSVALGFMAIPILYYLTEIGLLQGTFCITPTNVCFINSYLSATVWGIVGVFMLFVFLHALNGLARVSGMLAKAMLENN